MTEQRERVERFSRELREGPEPSDRSLKEIVQALQPQIQELVNKQIELAKAEMTPVGKQAGIATGLLAVGAVFLLLFSGFFFATGVLVMVALGFPAWVAAGIISVILLVIGGGLAGAGANTLRQLDPKPQRTMTALRQNIDWLKGQLKP